MFYNISVPVSNAKHELHDGIAFKGVKSGFKTLDDITGGLWNKELIVIGSRPSMGKTAMILSFLERTAIDDERTSVFFSLECSMKQMVKRMIYHRAHVNCFSTKRSNEESGYIIDAVAEINNGRLFIDDTPGISPSYIRERCREIQRNQNIWLIAVDYLQLMHMDGFNSQREMLNSIVRELKMIATEYDCPVILLSQLSRNVESRADHHPMLSDIHDVGELDKVADEILFLYRDDYYYNESNEKGIADLQIAKCLHSNIGRVKLAYLPEYSMFCDFRRVT